MAQYKKNSLKPGKAYKPLKLTASNCAIDVEEQVKRYAKWAKKAGLKTVHIFPPKRTGNSRRAYDKLLKCDIDPNTRLVKVDPEDWK